MNKEKLRKLFHFTQIREMPIEKLQRRRKEANQASIFFLAVGVLIVLMFALSSELHSNIWNKMIMLSMGVSLFVLHLGLSHVNDLESLEIKMELRIRELEQKLREEDG